jgi:RNA polymerase sigma-70 factor (ECF subfamily)
MSDPALLVRDAVAHQRERMWMICYRMTGRRADADDLAHEAAVRAMERAAQLAEHDATGWLLRLTTRVCLDHLRRAKIERRLTELADPLDQPCAPCDLGAPPDDAVALREDVRFAVIVALQCLSPRQRAALVLHDVCDRSLDEVADALETNANAAKALLHRARVALRDARRRSDTDVPVDATVVDAFARAIDAGSIEALTALLDDDAWGIVDGGGIVQASNKPTFGARVISRQWENAQRKLGQPVTGEVRSLNGEAAVVIRLAAMREVIVAIVHLETKSGRVVALRINRDPRSITRSCPG